MLFPCETVLDGKTPLCEKVPDNRDTWNHKYAGMGKVGGSLHCVIVVRLTEDDERRHPPFICRDMIVCQNHPPQLSDILHASAQG